MKSWNCSSCCYPTKKFLNREDRLNMLLENRDLLVKELQKIDKKIKKVQERI